jgi:hypothetical protein
MSQDAPHIRLDARRRESARVARLLEGAGGHPVPGHGGAIYRFATGAARDVALDRVRGEFGWTMATAFDGPPRPAAWTAPGSPARGDRIGDPRA